LAPVGLATAVDEGRDGSPVEGRIKRRYRAALRLPDHRGG
jgi:hypothetical protein